MNSIEIARYREKRFDGQRDFRLFDDRIVVAAKDYLGSESENSVMLNTLVPVLGRGRGRSSGFSSGILMAAVAFGLLQSGTLDLFSHWGGLTFCVGIGGALMSIVTARKIEWVYLSSEAGIISVSIAKCGPDKASFDAFVERLLAQVYEVVRLPVQSGHAD